MKANRDRELWDSEASKLKVQPATLWQWWMGVGVPVGCRISIGPGALPDDGRSTCPVEACSSCLN